MTDAGSTPERAVAASEFRARIDTIEEAYEFFLAYASQGLPSDRDSDNGRQAREFLRRCEAALTDLGTTIASHIARIAAPSADTYRPFIEVIDRDARDARAAIQIVIAQPSISSALIDNLNASIHLRALLTDLFLIDEALKSH